jgi:benzoylformate decarboxylase
VRYLFYNPGSREARFFDSLYSHPEIEGIISLHEGAVAAMAGGFSQVNAQPAVMSVHLGAGLAQCLGQFINVWAASLPVVLLTFHGDTGSYADRITLDVGHNVAPTTISAPFTKANWTVMEPAALPQAIDRAIKVATTPPIGPVHIAIYDRLLGPENIDVQVIDRAPLMTRAGYPSDADIEELARTLHEAERPHIYVGDGAWKSGAEALVSEAAERFGATVASMWGDLRGVSAAHPLHCGYFRGPALDIKPDHIVCVGVRHGGSGSRGDYAVFGGAKKIVAVGPDVEIFENVPNLDLAIMADEKRTMEKLLDLANEKYPAGKYDKRRSWALGQAKSLREQRRKALQPAEPIPGKVRQISLLDALDSELEARGGGIITTEQFAIPLECVNAKEKGGNVLYIRPAGGSEGYGMGAPMGAKLAAPDRHVVGLVGDGSVYYSDSAFWSAVHHRIPVLYVIPNNGTYGIVAGAFDRAEGVMNDTRRYAGVVLDGIDIIGIARSFGVDGRVVDDESRIAEEIGQALDLVEREQRPYVLDVKLPLGLPPGGTAARQFTLAKD